MNNRASAAVLHLVRAVNFKENVDQPVRFRAGAAGRMRFPKASDKGLISGKTIA